MVFLRFEVISAFLLLTVSFSGCGQGKIDPNAPANANTAANTSENGNSPNTNVEELGVLINVPFTAEDIVWKQSASHKQLTAVFRFSNADCEKLVAEAAKAAKPQGITVPNESWYPDDLIALGDLSGDDTLKGTLYSANAFLQAPFNEGRLVRIDSTNYFILEANAK
jgi:uncharacterized lipoprotein YehR (DUF1307 family)